MTAFASLRWIVGGWVLLVLLASGAGAAAAGLAGQRQDAAAAAPPANETERLAAAARAAAAGRRHADAEAAYRALLELTRRTAGERSIEAAAVLQSLAGAVEAQRRYTHAEALRREAQTIIEAHYALLRAAGRFADVRGDAERRGIDLYSEMLGLNLVRQGRGGEADQQWSRIRSQRSGDRDTSDWQPPEIGGMGSLPAIDTELASRVPAEGRLPTPAERERIHELRSRWRAALAGGDVATARSRYRDRLSLQEATLGPRHPETLDTMRSFAADLIRHERYGEAEPLARETLERHRAAPGGQAMTAAAAELLARSLMGLARWSEAQPLLEAALAAFDRAGRSADDATEVALALAATHYEQDHLGEAAQFYRRAAQGYERIFGPLHPETLTVRQFLAFVLFRDRRFGESVAEYRATCAGRIERARAFGRGELAGTDGSRSADAAECARRYARALREQARSDRAAEEALRAEAFRAAQTFVQSAAGDSLARAGARIAAGGAGAGEIAEQFERRLAERDALNQSESSEAGRAAARARLDGEIAILAHRLATRHPLYWDLRSPEPLDIVQLQARSGPDRVLLRDDELLVLFLVPPGQAHGIVFAVSRDRVAWADIPLNGDELTARVRTLRSQIDPQAYGVVPPAGGAGPGGTAPFDRQIAYELYRALLGDPAIQFMIAGPATLLIVPSGPLTSLPPALLVTAPPEGGTAGDSGQEALRRTPWLLRSNAVALLPAVSSLRTLRQLLPERAPPTDPLLAFTDPDFGGGIDAFLRPPGPMRSYFRSGVPLGDALRNLRRLGGTRREGEALARALRARPNSVLTGADASEAELLARNADGRLARVRVLDFATHGLIAGDALGLVEPGLALAVGPTPEESLLTASEAARLTINAEWVLLSACNTASPAATEAQGLSGLARAFFHAGARSLLVSHWRVDDAVAAWLIPRILTEQRRNPQMTRAEALRSASLAVLDNDEADAAHPYYWAPFTLLGEAGH